jgi:epoxyqueuosine reductase
MFPREYRVALHDRMYGCDDCQSVCPVNRLAARRDPPPPADASAETHVDILGILESSDAQLLETFGRWYIPRRDPKYIRRNALLVLGNVADPGSQRARTAVVEALQSAEPVIRGHAVWAAARLGYTELIPDAGSECDPGVREEIDAAPTVPSRTAGHPGRDMSTVPC